MIQSPIEPANISVPTDMISGFAASERWDMIPGAINVEPGES